MQKYLILKNSDLECKYINENLCKYNAKNVPFTQEEAFIPLNFHIKDKSNQIIAGINALQYCWKIIYIDGLFVEEYHRKKSLGSLLLNHIENIAREEGVKLIHLDTFEWQAKNFYLKHGFEIFGELKDCPVGYSRYYLKKILK